MKYTSNSFRILNTIAFIVFCIAIGQFASALLTSFVYDINASQILNALTDPTTDDKGIIILLSLSYTLLGFFIIPITYLLLTDKANEVKFLWIKSKIRFVPLLLSVITVMTIIPLITVLIEINGSIDFPIWLSVAEDYFKKGEENARQLTSTLLSFRNPGDLIVAISIIAIIPGIIEEIFFRGIVQTQLLGILKNSHYAIWTAAFLFSFFHFQFYGFIPRLILGALLGYIFLLTKNVWYSCAAHVVNNLIGVLGSYFSGIQFLSNDNDIVLSFVLALPSIAITTFIIFSLKRIEGAKILISDI